MSIKINRYMLTQTCWDSGSLTPLASVTHQFKQPGKYQGLVLRGDETVGLFDLVVDNESPKTQVNIDLEAVYQRKFSQSEQAGLFVVNPQVPTLFFVPRGRGGYSVVVRQSDAGSKTPEFDSRELKDGDAFIITPNRSGIYSVTNNNKAKGEIIVQKRKERTIPTEPVIIKLAEAFKPAKVKAEFSQPLYYIIKAPSRIRVQLEKQADDVRQRQSKTPRKRKLYAYVKKRE